MNISLQLPPELQEVTNDFARPISPGPTLIEHISPIEMLPPPPPYSNLKGSSKPTFREWKNKTQRATIPDFPKKNDMAEKINKIKAKMKEDKNNEPLPISSKTNNNNLQPKTQTKTKTVKNKLGKQGGKVSVLIKDNKTRRKVQFEQSNLRSKPISDIKEYLKKKQLLKVGSKAPPEVLRQIYEDSQLTGDITNKNSETLLHNYISEST